MSTVYCLLSTVYSLLSTVQCLQSIVYCLLSTIYCQPYLSEGSEEPKMSEGLKLLRGGAGGRREGVEGR